VSLNITRLNSAQPNFTAELSKLTQWQDSALAAVEGRVANILELIRTEGDQQLLKLTQELDRWSPTQAAELEVSDAEIEAAITVCNKEELAALELAAQRIREFHQKQTQESWRYNDEQGNLLGQQITPIERVGIYVPGGKASYPSSVLMNSIPAKVAGVAQVIMVTPTPAANFNPLVFAAAKIAGVDKIFRVGGAQAVAALAYGTETVPAVDKIVGPGNSYVAAAKRQIFGRVGIDMVAGPSEILVIGDGSVDPEWVAMDLLSQAEHDEVAQAIFITPDVDYLEQVAAKIESLISSLERETVARASMENKGILIQSANIAEAVSLSNKLAPEHLELAIEDPESWLPKVKNAGAIFLGAYSPEAIGDYCAGPNHVLPTSATARFSSPLGVYDFQKRSSIIGCSKEGAAGLAKTASVLARSESLTAHARSAEYRLK
jgi:histidinol dehydrogenase|tara:strand:+ start:104695 stop:105996 length:1302 start_codon:yes stop_codon:yes gene_type:complete